jgi:hypothetical protein
MFRVTAGFVLISLLAIGDVPVLVAQRTVTEQVAKLKVGRRVKVKLNTGEVLKGRMGSTVGDQFTLEPVGKTQGTARVVQFNEAESVRPDGLTAGKKWLIFGVAAWIGAGIVAKLTV